MKVLKSTKKQFDSVSESFLNDLPSDQAGPLRGVICDLVDMYDAIVNFEQVGKTTYVRFEFSYRKDHKYFLVKIKEPEPGNSYLYDKIGKTIRAVFGMFIECELPGMGKK